MRRSRIILPREHRLCSLTSFAGLRASASFTPRELFDSGINGAWYDLLDPAGMYQDDTGTTAAVLDGVVGYVPDKSGHGQHITQANAAARPILRQASGQYYLEFGGSDDSLRNHAFFDFGDQYETWCVGSISATADPGQAFFEVGTGSSNTGFMLYCINATSITWRGRDVTANRSCTFPGISIRDDVTRLYTGWSDGTTLTLRQNDGTSVNVSYTAPNANTLSVLSVGQLNPSGSPNALKGTLRELIILAGNVSAARRREVEQYLATRHGVTLA